MFKSLTVNYDLQYRLETKCSNFSVLNEHIMEFTEYELKLAMYFEKENKNRFNILNRLYSRYTKVRAEREKKELFS